jgi:formamidopyrimidine-DNA glycosylase
MPELPEVETVVRELRDVILDRRIKKARLLKPDMLEHSAAKIRAFPGYFKGRAFASIERFGKFMLFTLDNDDRLVAHFGMTGKFVVADGSHPEPDYLCSQYVFSDGGRLDHIDVRRFGRLELHKNGATIPVLERLGIDPLSDDFDAEYMWKSRKNKGGKKPRTRAIHTLLMDQNLIAGIGNIYASEALFRAGVRPQRAAGKLTRKECEKLAPGLKEILLAAVTHGGTTVNDYRRVDDKPGNFLNMLQVYDRAGEFCRKCSTEIIRLPLNGRSAFYCLRCQK